MAWSTPDVREVCVGMEVTSYLSAERCDITHAARLKAGGVIDLRVQPSAAITIANTTIVVIGIP